MAKQNDGLFLLEVLVDKIIFSKSPCFSDKDFKTCINIECPGVEPIEICDDEPGTCIVKSDGPFIKSFNSGKSCLFSLNDSQISTAMSKFPINVSVYKSLPCGCLPTKIIMGECKIDMTKEFVEARKTFLEDPTNVSYQALKDSFHIVGPDGSETGEVVMFLRISCFGKLIITRFQGPGGSPNLGPGKNTGIVDRSCTPKKDYQTMQDPCACQMGRTLGSGGIDGNTGMPCDISGGNDVCPAVKDLYNSMPCMGSDDPCYCSGSKPQPPQEMACRNMDQYCLHVPKGTRSRQKLIPHQNLADDKLPLWKIEQLTFEDVQVVNNKAPMKCALSKKPTNLFFNITDCAWESYDSVVSLASQNIKDIGLFGRKDTSIYMTLSHNFCGRRSSGTQATASINKSFQVCDEWKNQINRYIDINSDYCSTCSVSTFAFKQYSCRVSENLLNPEIYFFGKKKEKTDSKGMGSKASYSKLQKSSQTTSTGCKSDLKKSSSKSSVQSGSTTTVKKPSSTKTSKPKPNLPIKKSKGAATASGTSKTVTIKDEKPQKPCPALGTTKGDMMVTVSHIKIGPKETCPVHGNSPCQGPKCVLASSGEEQGSVNVTTVNNPRKGVFEVTIRRLTGAPLAKNELMLEWTPPPSRPLPCNAPRLLPYIPARPCRHSKCKLIVCKPSPCKPKCSRKKPCGQACCRLLPGSRCYKTKCCDSPCHSCKPCPPKPCCPTSKCIKCVQPCKTPCAVPCKSSPCLKPCPVGRKRPRKSRSQPRIKSYHKKHSPCYNRSKACPVVRCRSIPGPCIMHCGIRPPCLPRNYISVLPSKLKKASIESCLKSCSSCCG